MSGAWKMPEWMQSYAEHIGDTGGNDIEELANGRTSPAINLPLALIETAVTAQVGLLIRLRCLGMLRPSLVYVVLEAWPLKNTDPDLDDPSRVISVVLTAEEAKKKILNEVGSVKGWVISEDGLSAELNHKERVLYVEPWNPAT